MRILIADEEALFRDALRTLVEERGHVVVGEAARSPEAVVRARRTVPDVAVLGLEASRSTTLAAIRTLASELPATAVVLLASSAHADLLHAALGAGARAVLTRDLHGSRFCDLLERVATGGVTRPRTPPARRATNPAMTLTPREREVLGTMARGCTSNRELAATLGLSENTVRFHVRNILEKLHLHTRAAAVAHALTRGIVSGGG